MYLDFGFFYEQGNTASVSLMISTSVNFTLLTHWKPAHLKASISYDDENSESLVKRKLPGAFIFLKPLVIFRSFNFTMLPTGFGKYL